MSDFLLLVKLQGANYKCQFPRRPTVADVAKEVAKQAGLSPSLEVVFSAPDPDFPGETVVLGPTAELANKQVLAAETQAKVHFTRHAHARTDLH